MSPHAQGTRQAESTHTHTRHCRAAGWDGQILFSAYVSPWVPLSAQVSLIRVSLALAAHRSRTPYMTITLVSGTQSRSVPVKDSSAVLCHSTLSQNSGMGGGLQPTDVPPKLTWSLHSRLLAICHAGRFTFERNTSCRLILARLTPDSSGTDRKVKVLTVSVS